MRKGTGPWPELTWEQYDIVVDYTNQVADYMNLGHWEIEIDTDPLDSNNSAETKVTVDRYVAVILLARDFAKESPEERRNTIIHELLHCHFDAMTVAWDPVKELLGTLLWNPTYDAYMRALELVIDSLSSVMEDQFGALHFPE